MSKETEVVTGLNNQIKVLDDQIAELDQDLSKFEKKIDQIRAASAKIKEVTFQEGESKKMEKQAFDKLERVFDGTYFVCL